MQILGDSVDYGLDARHAGFGLVQPLKHAIGLGVHAAEQLEHRIGHQLFGRDMSPIQAFDDRLSLVFQFVQLAVDRAKPRRVTVERALGHGRMPAEILAYPRKQLVGRGLVGSHPRIDRVDILPEIPLRRTQLAAQIRDVGTHAFQTSTHLGTHVVHDAENVLDRGFVGHATQYVAGGVSGQLRGEDYGLCDERGLGLEDSAWRPASTRRRMASPSVLISRLCANSSTSRLISGSMWINSLSVNRFGRAICVFLNDIFYLDNRRLTDIVYFTQESGPRQRANANLGPNHNHPAKELVMDTPYVRDDSVQRKTATRRTILTSTTVAAILPTAAAHATAADPHPAWLEEWRELTAFRSANREDGMEDDAALNRAINETADRIEDTPATTPAGLAAKFEFFREFNLDFDDCYVDPDGANALISEAVAFLGAMS